MSNKGKINEENVKDMPYIYLDSMHKKYIVDTTIKIAEM